MKPFEIPSCFLVKNELPTLTFTAEPTGLLADPIDLLTKSRPWVSFQPRASKRSTEKKTLVFADATYGFRWEISKKIALDHLEKMIYQGFKIFILKPTGELVPYENPCSIPDDYSLPLEQFPREKIASLAFTQYQIDAHHLYILDYFTFQYLNLKEKWRLDWCDFINHHPEALRSIEHSEQKQFLVILNQKEHLTNFELFSNTYHQALERLGVQFKWEMTEDRSLSFHELTLEQMRTHRYIPSIYSYLTYELDTTPNQLLNFLKTATSLVQLDLENAICDLNDAIFIEQLTPGLLPNLTSVNFCNSNIEAPLLNAWLKAAPELKTLDLSETSPLCEGAFLCGDCASLKLTEVSLSGSTFSNKGLEAFLTAAPKLENLDLTGWDSEFYTVFSKYKFKKHPHLTEVTLMDSSITTEGVIDLFQMANFVCVNLVRCDIELDKVFLSLSQEFLCHLKKLDVYETHVNLEALLQLAEKAPLLETLDGIELDPFLLLPDNAFPNLCQVQFLLFSTFTSEIEARIERIAPRIKLMDYTSFGMEPMLSTSSNEGDEKEAEHNATFEDFDTNLAQVNHLTFEHYFPRVEANLYRLYYWDPDLNTVKFYNSKLFKPTDFVDAIISPIQDSSQVFEGLKQVEREDGTEILLPSLSAQEKLVHLNVVSRQEKSVPVILQYSPSTHFYRIKLSELGQYDIHFSVEVPKEKPALPFLFTELATRYRQFIKKPLSQPRFPSLREFAQYCRINQTGSCAHRSLAAYVELTEIHQIPKEKLKIVCNDVHAYLEFDGASIDLGGYEIPLVKKTKRALLHSTVEKNVSEVNPGPDIKVMTSFNEIRSFTTPILLIAPSDTVAYCIYCNLLQVYPSHAIFIANSPDEFNLSDRGLDITGELKKPYTRFYRWVSTHAEGCIVVDIRGFQNHVAKLNDLLDHIVDGVNLSPNLKVMILSQTDTGFGPDFKRRVKLFIHFPSIPNQPLIHEANPEPYTYIIDLYNSPFWERTLIGYWSPVSDQGSIKFIWKNGAIALLAQLEQMTGSLLPPIWLRNPPMHDLKFRQWLTQTLALRRVELVDQILDIPPHWRFNQTRGMLWENLYPIVSLHVLSDMRHKPLVLSNSNLLSFTEEYRLNPHWITHQMESAPGYFKQAEVHSLTIALTPDVTEDTLAEFLNQAMRQQIHINICVTHPSLIHPKLSSLPFYSYETPPHASNVTWELHDDLYFAVRRYLLLNPDALHLDLRAAESMDFGFYPQTERLVASLNEGYFQLSVKPSALMVALIEGKTIVLSGHSAAPLYEALQKLCQGHVHQAPFLGRVILMTDANDAELAVALLGCATKMPPKALADKQSLWAMLYPNVRPMVTSLEHPFLQWEKTYWLSQCPSMGDLTLGDDTTLAIQFDEIRISNLYKTLNLTPWVKIVGQTGIGKTYFLTHILKESPKFRVFFKIKDWGDAKPVGDEKLVLIVDEANLNHELTQMNEYGFLRFRELMGLHPKFNWEGCIYGLTHAHGVVFALNHASYGGGRREDVFLEEWVVPLHFPKLPSFYIRAMMVAPLLKVRLGGSLDLNKIAAPLVEVYQWLMQFNLEGDKTLITPRELKYAINLLGFYIRHLSVTDEALMVKLAREVAFNVGHQTLSDIPLLYSQFESHFALSETILTHRSLPSGYATYQAESYFSICDMIQTRAMIAGTAGDLGLGGVILEGPTGIGKSHFIKQMMMEYRIEHPEQVVQFVSPNLSYMRKKEILCTAQEGTIIVANKFNTSLWPTKELNHFLMGLNPEGQRMRTPGLFFATQNPGSYQRQSADNSQSRRLYKVNLHWPFWTPPISSPSSGLNHGL